MFGWSSSWDSTMTVMSRWLTSEVHASSWHSNDCEVYMTHFWGAWEFVVFRDDQVCGIESWWCWDDRVRDVQMTVMSRRWGACEFVIFSEREMTWMTVMSRRPRESSLSHHISRTRMSWWCQMIEFVMFRSLWCLDDLVSHLSLTNFTNLHAPQEWENLEMTIIWIWPTISSSRVISLSLNITNSHAPQEWANLDMTIISIWPTMSSSWVIVTNSRYHVVMFGWIYNISLWYLEFQIWWIRSFSHITCVYLL